MNGAAIKPVKLSVAEWRERRGLTILQLSERAGVNRSNLYAIERGETKGIDFNVLAKLADALTVKPSQLISP